MIATPQRIVGDKEEIWLHKDQILRISLKDGFDFDDVDLMRQFDAYKKLVGKKRRRHAVLVDVPGYFNMHKEARDLAAKTSKYHFSACAIISGSLATRIIVNFLNSFYEFGFPIRMFSSESQAMEWLSQYT